MVADARIYALQTRALAEEHSSLLPWITLARCASSPSLLAAPRSS